MIRCVKCDNVSYIKKSGVIKGRQRYFCKQCNLFFMMPGEKKQVKQTSHQVTILDIAKQLNLSKSTVSRALKNHPDINADTKGKVLELAAKLDYQPNLLASSLVKSKSFTVGIIVPEFFNSFFPNIIMGAEEVLAKAGYKLIICHSNESYDREVDHVKLLLSSRVDGFLISLTHETTNYAHLKAIVKKGLPLVLYNRVCEELDVPKVVVNDYEGAFNATEHLILNGYKKIAHIAGPENLLISKNRLQGYLEALSKYKVETKEERIVRCNLSPESARKAAACLFDLPDRPDAIFCVNDTTAIEVIQLAKMRGIAIPKELAVVGFTDDIVSKFIEPGLTTIAQPVKEIGKSAAQLLLKELDNTSGRSAARLKILSSELIIRGSSSYSH